jgi:hypothetical protein
MDRIPISASQAKINGGIEQLQAVSLLNYGEITTEVLDLTYNRIDTNTGAA